MCVCMCVCWEARTGFPCGIQPSHSRFCILNLVLLKASVLKSSCKSDRGFLRGPTLGQGCRSNLATPYPSTSKQSPCSWKQPGQDLAPLALEVCANLSLLRKSPGWREGLLLTCAPKRRGEVWPCDFLVQKALSGPNPCPVWGCWTLNNDPAP